MRERRSSVKRREKEGCGMVEETKGEDGLVFGGEEEKKEGKGTIG